MEFLLSSWRFFYVWTVAPMRLRVRSARRVVSGAIWLDQDLLKVQPFELCKAGAGCSRGKRSKYGNVWPRFKGTVQTLQGPAVVRSQGTNKKYYDIRALGGVDGAGKVGTTIVYRKAAGKKAVQPAVWLAKGEPSNPAPIKSSAKNRDTFCVVTIPPFVMALFFC